MISINLSTILMLSLPAAALALAARFYDPQRPLSRLLGYMLAGFLMLMGWNLFFQPHVGVNPLSSAITGLLGLPGIGLTIVLNLL